MPIAAMVALAYVFSGVFRKRRQLGVGLSKSGVYHWSWFGCCFYKWEWIFEARAVAQGYGTGGLNIVLDVHEPAGRPANDEENWIADLDFFRKKRRVLTAGYLAVNPVLPYLALNFYLRHPEFRKELGTELASDRMKRLDFPDVISEVRRFGAVRPVDSPRGQST
ncbi:hypothetical protein ABN034_13440 [Actinopolymorpha sp. B11F2]|uniref:hypothetical protein n=1 Tax=Actinopolymorpha sp. B11F2 TaxID=3160862 RepID=UPI0032E39CE7